MWLQITRLRLYKAVLGRGSAPSNSPMSVNQAFLLATRNGGLALRREDVGIIAPGAMADVVVFDGDTPGMVAWVDPIAAVILHSNVGDVEHVIVNGEFVKRDRQLTSTLYEEIKARFLVSARRIQQRWREIPYPVLVGPFKGEIGVELAPTKTVDVERGEGDGYGTLFV